VVSLRTDRLVLRPWRDDDREPFAAMNADPAVMQYFPATMDRAASDGFVDRIEARLAETGWGLWAVEVPGVAPFVGYVGVQPVSFEAQFTPAVEIGWRMARAHWNHGYATEGARAAVAHGFDELGLDEIVGFTVVANAPSRRVMDKLGMTHDPADDFDHPRLPDWDQRRHVLYRLRRNSGR
jgi:RimJ/RimL family protein N-acetyltransferase